MSAYMVGAVRPIYSKGSLSTFTDSLGSVWLKIGTFMSIQTTEVDQYPEARLLGRAEGAYTPSARATLRTGSSSFVITSDGYWSVVDSATANESFIYSYDTDAVELGSFSVAHDAKDLCYDGSYLYTVSGATVYKIDVAGTVFAEFTLSGNLVAICWDKYKEMFVTVDDAGNLRGWNPDFTANSLSFSVATESQSPVGVCADRTLIFIVDADYDYIYQYSSDGTYSSSIPIDIYDLDSDTYESIVPINNICFLDGYFYILHTDISTSDAIIDEYSGYSYLLGALDGGFVSKTDTDTGLPLYIMIKKGG